MKKIRRISGLLAICAVAAFLTGCGEDDDTNPSTSGGSVGRAPGTLNGKNYELSEPAGTSTISFGDLGNNYTLSRAGMAQESGAFVGTRVGNDTWDIILNNSLDGSASRLVLTFTAIGSGNFSFTAPNAAPINGNFQLSGFGNTTTGNTTTGTTTTGTTTTGTTTTGTTTTGTSTSGNTTTGGSSVTAPPSLSQIVLNGNSSNPAGGGQTVINITGNTFVYASGGFSGTVLYTPSGSTARLRLTYTGTSSGDVDDYTLQFLAPSGSSTPSTFSGTQKIGNAAPGAASGTFTYTQ